MLFILYNTLNLLGGRGWNKWKLVGESADKVGYI